MKTCQRGPRGLKATAMEAFSPDQVMAEAAFAAPAPELAVAFTDVDRLKRLIAATSSDPSGDWLPMIGLSDAAFAPLIGSRRVSRVHFGNEFCERLLPSRSVLDSVVKLVSGAGLGFSLVTPTLTDDGLGAVEELLDAVPDGGEVVVNDWGLMRRRRHRFPRLRASAGRLLCKLSRYRP